MSERIEAFIRLAVPLICLVLSWFSVEVDSDELLTVCLAALSVLSGIWAWWKDNNVTKKAIERHEGDER